MTFVSAMNHKWISSQLILIIIFHFGLANALLLCPPEGYQWSEMSEYMLEAWDYSLSCETLSDAIQRCEQIPKCCYIDHNFKTSKCRVAYCGTSSGYIYNPTWTVIFRQFCATKNQEQLYQLGLHELKIGLEFHSFRAELVRNVPSWLAERAGPVQLTQTQPADLDRYDICQLKSPLYIHLLRLHTNPLEANLGCKLSSTFTKLRQFKFVQKASQYFSIHLKYFDISIVKYNKMIKIPSSN